MPNEAKKGPKIIDMDTVQEENDGSDSNEESTHSDVENLRERTNMMLSARGKFGSGNNLMVEQPHIYSTSQPGSRRVSSDNIETKPILINARRPSAIIAAAFRRPSQALALCAATQRKYLSEMVTQSPANSILSIPRSDHLHCYTTSKIISNESMSKALSAFYAKLMVVLGLTFPVTQVISNRVPSTFFQGFYLYLYLVSIAFILFTYGMIMRNKAKHIDDQEEGEVEKPKSKEEEISRFGSFYLRLGAMAFGIGSMVYSGLELGGWMEEGSSCKGLIAAFTPAARVVLTLLQMQFIFICSKDLEVGGHKMIQRFGLMHMLAMNLCEWLHVLVAETEHEMHHLQHVSPIYTAQHILRQEASLNVTIEPCIRVTLMGGLIQSAAPFLFPCTVEYSLICAVIIYEMWKEVKCTPEEFEKKINSHSVGKTLSRNNSVTPEKILQQFANLMGVGGDRNTRAQHLSVDCSSSARGVFAGVTLVVLVIISLIMFFVLVKSPNTEESAIFEVNIVEIILSSVMLLATIAAYLRMRTLAYKRRQQEMLGLDTSLLMLAQIGMFVYCMFSITGSYFTLDSNIGDPHSSLAADLITLIQTIIQSLFIIDGWWRRCRRSDRTSKPGRQLVTFLLIGNMAAWAVNTLEKNRAEFRPAHLEFYGPWAWTVLTHASMPLAIFYRFHSTICLFEIWKNTYKTKPIYLNI